MHIGSLYTGYVNFNPRTHEGCDTDSKRRNAYAIYFNPRTHEGCDLEV